MSQSKKKKITIVVLLFLFLLLAIGGAWYFNQSKSTTSMPLDSQAQKYNSKIKKPEDWPKTKIAYPVYGSTKVLEGAKYLYIALQNPKFNEANLRYTLYLDKEDDKAHQLIHTGLIEPGKAVTKVPLPKELTAGDHTIYVHTKAFAPNDKQTKLNSVNTSFVLTVLKKE